MTICADGRESLLFDRGRAEVYALEDTWVQDVDTGVDAVSHEFHWLLDESIDSRCVVWFMNNDTIFGGLVNLGYDDGTFVTMLLVESSQFGEGIFADDI